MEAIFVFKYLTLKGEQDVQKTSLATIKFSPPVVYIPKNIFITNIRQV